MAQNHRGSANEDTDPRAIFPEIVILWLQEGPGNLHLTCTGQEVHTWRTLPAGAEELLWVGGWVGEGVGAKEEHGFVYWDPQLEACGTRPGGGRGR